MANPGGFLEPATSTDVRPPCSIALPDRGAFVFPPPYNTVGIRVTNEFDTGGGDALWYTGYSYWQAINAHQGRDALLIFLGVDRNRGGAGPSLWSIDKASDIVTPLGAIFEPDDPLSWQTAEGWYWSAVEPTLLYATDERHLYRVDVGPRLEGGPARVTTVADISTYRSGVIAWQWHSSSDGTVHSATLKDASTYAAEGAIVYIEGDPNPWREYPRRGAFDECQIDKSGAWLLTKDNVDNSEGEDNLLYAIGANGEPRVLLDENGAAGHSDNGFGYMVAADNWAQQPSAFRLWMFDGREPQGRLVYQTSSWSAQLGHLSHCNARPESPDGQFVIGSGASRTAAPRNNEIVAFTLAPDALDKVLVIAPVLTNLDAPGGGTDDYAKLPKGNCDIAGSYFLWTGNAGGDRLDAFVVKVPAQLLINGPPPSPTWTVTAPDGTVRRFVEVP